MGAADAWLTGGSLGRGISLPAYRAFSRGVRSKAAGYGMSSARAGRAAADTVRSELDNFVPHGNINASLLQASRELHGGRRAPFGSQGSNLLGELDANLDFYHPSSLPPGSRVSPDEALSKVPRGTLVTSEAKKRAAAKARAAGRKRSAKYGPRG